MPREFCETSGIGQPQVRAKKNHFNVEHVIIDRGILVQIYADAANA